MTYIPHLQRVQLFDTIRDHRHNIHYETTKAALSTAGDTARFREQQTIRDWCFSNEFAQMSDQEIQYRECQAVQLLEYADHCMTLRSAQYDISSLIPALPRESVSDYSLRDVVIPGDFMYLDFGPNSPFKVAAGSDLRFSGAYVAQYDTVHEESAFEVTIVCDDPNFMNAMDIPYGQYLKRLTQVARFMIRPDRPVYDAFSDINLYSDRSVTTDFKACFAAFDATIKSIIYMNQFAADIEFHVLEGGLMMAPIRCFEGIEFWLEHDRPNLHYVGRYTDRIEHLEEPDLERMTAAFG